MKVEKQLESVKVSKELMDRLRGMKKGEGISMGGFIEMCVWKEIKSRAVVSGSYVKECVKGAPPRD